MTVFANVQKDVYPKNPPLLFSLKSQLPFLKYYATEGGFNLFIIVEENLLDHCDIFVSQPQLEFERKKKL